MITNFTERNGKLRHDLTQQGSALAALRKSYLDYEVASREMTMYPGGDDTGHTLKFTSQLPFGAVLGTPEIKTIVGDVTGIEYAVTGSPLLKKIQIVDLQGSKITSALGEYAWNGSKEVWYCDPVGIGFQDGFWNVKELAIEGKDNFRILMQGESPPDPEGFTSYQPEWTIGSPAFCYAEGLRNVVYGADGELKTAHGTGKFAHPSRPYAMAWDSQGKPLKIQGQIVVVPGEWVETTLGIKKRFPQQQIQALITAGASLISVDATLGTTTVGSLSGSFGFSQTIWCADPGGYPPLANGNIASVHYYGHLAGGVSANVKMSAHDIIGSTLTYVAGAVTAFIPLEQSTSGRWHDADVTGAAAITTSMNLFPTNVCSGGLASFEIYYDNGGSGGIIYYRITGDFTTTNTAGAQSFNLTRITSTYFTLAEAGGGIVNPRGRFGYGDQRAGTRYSQ